MFLPRIIRLFLISTVLLCAFHKVAAADVPDDLEPSIPAVHTTPGAISPTFSNDKNNPMASTLHKLLFAKQASLEATTPVEKVLVLPETLDRLINTPLGALKDKVIPTPVLASPPKPTLKLNQKLTLDIEKHELFPESIAADVSEKIDDVQVPSVPRFMLPSPPSLPSLPSIKTRQNLQQLNSLPLIPGPHKVPDTTKETLRVNNDRMTK